MFHKTFTSFVFFLLFSYCGMAQNASITGKIWDNAKTPLVGVNVSIPSITVGTQTDANGLFELKNVPANKYMIKLSYIGYKTKEITVDVTPNQKTDLGNIIMYEGNELLQEIVVTASRENAFSRENTAYVSKLPLKDMDNPTVYSTITTELLEPQVVTSFDDAIANATGISKLWEATGRSPGEGTGYFSTRGFATQPKLVDGMPGFTFSAIDPSYIERIEVVKGPTATLFGSTVTSLGGLINVVTKKPYQGFGGSVTYTGGSFGMHRGTVDLNTPIGKGDNIFFRINSSYLTQNSWQDAGFRRTFFVAPSLSYKVNNRLNLSLGVEYSRTKQTNPSMLYLRRGLPIVSKNIEAFNTDPNKSFTSNDVALTNPILNTRAIVDYKISDNWTSQTVYASTHSKSYGYYQYLVEGTAAIFGGLQALQGVPRVDEILAESNKLLQTDAFARIFDKRDGRGNIYNIQQNFTGDFKIGEMRNRIVIGLDYANRSTKTKNQNGNSPLVSTPTIAGLIQTLQFLETQGLVPANTALGLSASFEGLPYFDGMFGANGSIIPNRFTPNTTYSPTKEQLDAVFAQVPAKTIETGSVTYAAYVSNVLNITNNLTAHIGLRLDHFDQEGDKNSDLDDFTKTTFSPNAGIVYQPLPNKLTLFTNLQTGFINNNPVVNPDDTVQNFEPTKARQFEGGIKTNLLDGKLNVGINYYHILVNDIVNSDPRNILFPKAITISEVVSKGFEFEINTNPVKGLNLRMSYSNNDKKITDAYSPTTETKYDELQDRRTEDASSPHIYNFWADYRFSFSENQILKNLGIGAGFNGASEHITLNNGVTGQFTLLAYTLFNASIYYNAEKFRVGFKVNNLTDEVYYRGWGTVNAQAPRTFLGTVSYKF